MKLMRIISGLAPALAIAALHRLRGPRADLRSDRRARGDGRARRCSACRGRAGRRNPRCRKARAPGYACLRGRRRRNP